MTELVKELTGDGVYKLLTLGIPGLVFLTNLLAFLLLWRWSDTNAQVYQAKVRALTVFCGLAIALLVGSVLGQYFLDHRTNSVLLVVQDADRFDVLAVKPIKIFHRAGDKYTLPDNGVSRVTLRLANDDQVDVDLGSVFTFIQNQRDTIKEMGSRNGTRPQEVGY